MSVDLTIDNIVILNKPYKTFPIYIRDNDNDNDNECSEIYILLKNMKAPFGVEEYKDKKILNIEIEDAVENNESYNKIAKMKNIENIVKIIPDTYTETNFSVKKKLLGKYFYPSLKIRNKSKPLLRTKLAKNIKILKNDKITNYDDITNKDCDFLIKVHSVWLSDDNFGINWIIEQITINDTT